MHIGPVGTEFVHVDGQTDGRTDEKTDRRDEANSHKVSNVYWTVHHCNS